MVIWRKVQPVLAGNYRVCAYNRAGIDGGTIGPMPRDAKAIASDLEKLIRHANLRPPFIVVGFSYGGMTMRLFALRNLKKIAGIVLVDPSEDIFQRIAPITTALFEDHHAELERLRRCTADILSPDCTFSIPDDAPASLRDRLVPTRPKEWFVTNLSEWESRGVGGRGPSSSQIREAGTDFGETPLVVLSADWILREEDIPEGKRQALQQAFIDAHKATAAQSRRGILKLVPGSSHIVPRDDPQAVIDAVNLVAAMARR